ncbi:MAG: hypothetical protein ACLGIC_06905 [Acidimicrobiia bacterium]
MTGPSDRPALAALPALDRAAIEVLAGGWSDGGLWAEVDWLAERFWAATDPAARSRRWHHLVLAVGNFKRQPGRRLRPTLDTTGPAVPGVPEDRFDVAGTDGPVTVAVDDPASWVALSAALPGAAVATTSTLLAALWPSAHFVFDWRVAAAANGLRARAELATAPGFDATATTTPDLGFDHYGRVRAWLLDTAAATGAGLVAAERALYRASQLVPAERGRDWATYGHAVVDAIAAAVAAKDTQR